MLKIVCFWFLHELVIVEGSCYLNVSYPILFLTRGLLCACEFLRVYQSICYPKYLRDQMTGRPSGPVLKETLDPPGTAPVEEQRQGVRSSTM